MALDDEDRTAIGTLIAEALKTATPEIVKAATDAADALADKRINQAFDPDKLVQKVLDRAEKKASGSSAEKQPETNGSLSERDKAMIKRSIRQSVKEQVAGVEESIRPYVLEQALVAAEYVTPSYDLNEDNVAKALVESVKGNVEKAKTSFEDGLRADLKARKLLIEEQGTGQPPDGGDQGTADSKDPMKLYEKGAAKAKEIFGDKKE